MIRNADERRALLQEGVSHLHDRFLRRSLADAILMREFIEKLRAGDATMLDEVAHLAHRICGTGGSLGFTALSACAMKIEQIAAAAPQEAAHADLCERLTAHTLRLEGEIGILAAAHAIR